MKTKSGKSTEYKEYILELEPEEEALLIELGSAEVLKDHDECINYAIKYLLKEFMGDNEDN